MKPRNITILGSTGSIGTQALKIIGGYAERFKVVGLSARSNWELLARQANHFQPDYLVLSGREGRNELMNMLDYRPKDVFDTPEDLVMLAELEENDIVLNSLVGFSGFKPTYAALKAGNRVALANKESLVVGGELISPFLKQNPGQLIPVDSEHSAMLQCMVGEPADSIEKIIITASGGPFRTWPEEKLEAATVEDALDHPNWSMGSKITIDSATLMNKGLEIIEARWLFDLPLDKIEPVIHPQSVIHSVVEFVDGSSKAQLGPPDMKVPILYSLTYPDRIAFDAPRVDWGRQQELTFEPVDKKRFPCIRLALEASGRGGFSPTVMNAANEVAVERFLKREIGYIEIAKIVGNSLERINCDTDLTPNTLEEVDRQTRDFAESL